MKIRRQALTMGLLSILFGCGDGSGRYHSQAEYESNLEAQAALTPQTMEQLHGIGVASDAELRLEFFFYTDTEEKAAKLAGALKDKGYDARSELAAAADGSFVVTGWTTKITMDTPVVVEWTKEMCGLGYSHDAEFDGWGTTPEQD
jgi:regulator of RNase E activity RraB